MARPVAARGQARGNVLEAALDLFTRHGVSGTSLQMIADSLGVTKAAVYYQFHSKEDIVLAIVDEPLRQTEAVLDIAEAQRDRAQQLETLLTGLVDLVLGNKRATALINNDHALAEIMASNEPLRRVAQRFTVIVLGPEPTAAGHVAQTVLASGLMVAGISPELAALDHATLRAELLNCGRRILNLAS